MHPVRTVEDVVDAPLGSVGMALDAYVGRLTTHGWAVQRQDAHSATLTRGGRGLRVALAAAGRDTVVRLECSVLAGPMAGLRERLLCRLVLAMLRTQARRIHGSGPPDGPPTPTGHGLRDEFRTRGLAVIEIPADEDRQPRS